jgi:SAM-dependent methyltransferase
LGYRVHLFDLSEKNIAMAEELGAEYPGVSLVAREVCDARAVDRPAESADAVLLMGPLYHITEREERIKDLAESRRLLKRGGLLFSAAITPYATLLWASSVFGKDNWLLEEESFLAMVRRELADGEHIRPREGSYRGIARAHFHRAHELEEELSAGGFTGHRVHGVVGAAWLAPDLDRLWEDAAARAALMKTVGLLDEHPDILGLSTHLLAVSKKES